MSKGNRKIASYPRKRPNLARMARTLAPMILGQLSPTAGTIAKVARVGYNAYNSRKRAAPQEPSKKKVVEKQLETQIAGGHGGHPIFTRNRC